MASITYDGQSFLLDGRRVWLVSGTIHPARVPRAQWAERIHAAKQAGLNCIEMPIVWSRHEPRHNQFDFTGENDIKEFTRLIHQAGLWCILRAGPFIDGGYDMGGLPPWLLTIEGLKLRTANQPFLEACSRYITALAGQLRDMQVSSPAPKGAAAPTHPGPIIMLRTEGGFTCGDDQLAHTYLGELDRYWREAGFNVPLINSNDLWQSVEGEIDGWTGYDALLSHLRQLGAIRPAQPRIVIDFQLGSHDSFGKPAGEPKAPGAVLRRLAEVLAAGGQFNIGPFHGGTNFGFSAGRDLTQGPAGFPTASADAGAPVNETGIPTAQYPAVRRICTFASRFSRVLSHLDPARQPVALLPETVATRAGEPGSRVSVIHAVGSQGGVVFVFGDDAGANNPAPMSLLLPDGSTLPVDLGDQSVVWCLLDTRLSGRANLDYCNLCAMALVGKVFVCFGAPGARGSLSINGSPLETTVPEGKNPIVQEHEGMTVVIASMAQIDRIFFDDNGVYVGVSGLDTHGKPITDEEAKSYTHIDAEGKVTNQKVHHANHAPKKSSRITLGEWSLAPLSEYAAGTSPRFASIPKPSDLVALGAPYGYGWYRLKIPSGSPRRIKLMFPQSAHRLHVIQDGEPIGIMGLGLNATTTLPVSLSKGSNTLVILAENAGRVSAGADLGEATGIYGHGWEVEPIKPAKPKLVPADPVDILAFRAPLWKMHRDDRSDAVRLTWTVQHRSKNPIIMEIGEFEEGLGIEREGGIVLLNGKPIHYFQQGGIRPIILPAEVLLKGNNEVQITLLGQTEQAADAMAKAVHFYDAVDSITVKAEWSFAKWELPSAGKFGKGGGAAKHKAAEACWWKCELTAAHSEEADGPVLIDCAGLTKGQIYVNGKHLCRYCVSSATGRRIPPQQRYVLPRSWLKQGANDLVIFDEHGATPTRVRIISDAKGGAFDR
jgi:hypothetical protein